MSLEFLTDTSFATSTRRVNAERVAAYVEATGDDAQRWVRSVPPSFAGALLFDVAPALLAHPDVAPFTAVLVHVDQRFSWHRSVPIDATVDISSSVSRVRSRGGSWFVTFEMAVTVDDAPAIDSVSTFLFGETAAGDPPAERDEPGVLVAGVSEPPRRYDPDAGVPHLAKSVSRSGLVRYAAASGDFNPIHFDHGAAVGAGLPGVVGHGLLTTAWVTQLAAGATDNELPLSELTVRFRDPMFPADDVVVGGVAHPSAEGLRRIDITVTAGDRTPVTGRATVREA